MFMHNFVDFFTFFVDLLLTWGHYWLFLAVSEVILVMLDVVLNNFLNLAESSLDTFPKIGSPS